MLAEPWASGAVTTRLKSDETGPRHKPDLRVNDAQPGLAAGAETGIAPSAPGRLRRGHCRDGSRAPVTRSAAGSRRDRRRLIRACAAAGVLGALTWKVVCLRILDLVEHVTNAVHSAQRVVRVLSKEESLSHKGLRLGRLADANQRFGGVLYAPPTSSSSVTSMGTQRPARRPSFIQRL